jgi:hypothetical protein
VIETAPLSAAFFACAGRRLDSVLEMVVIRTVFSRSDYYALLALCFATRLQVFPSAIPLPPQELLMR